MSEINGFMDDLLDYEMDEDDDDEELDNEILQLNHNKYSNVVEDVPKIELKESAVTLPMDVNEHASSNEEKQTADKPTSSLVSSEMLESVERVQLIPTSSSTSLFPSNSHDFSELWKKSYATLTKVMNNNNIVPTATTELAQAETVEASSSIYVKTGALNELSTIADDVSSLTINKSNNYLKDIGTHPVDSIVRKQKPLQNAIQHTTNMLVNLKKRESAPYENQNTNVNEQMPQQYKNLHAACIPMKINKQKPEQKPMQDQSQNTTILWSGENSKNPNSKRETSRNSRALTKGMELKRHQTYETVFHTKRDMPSLMSIKVLPPIESERQTRPVINNSNNLTTTASPFIITARNGAQSSRKVLINPSFKGFSFKANSSDANSAPIKSRDQSVDVRETMKRNLTDDDLRNKLHKRHKPINYEADYSEFISANGSANELKDDNESDEQKQKQKQYQMKIVKLKLIREEFQRKKELRRQQVGVDAYNEDLCRI